MKIGLMLSAGALAVAAVAVAAMPLQDAKAKTRGDDAAHGGMDHAAMEAEMHRLGTPGAEHANLKSMVGTWETHIKSYEDPSQPPNESNGTSSFEWLFDRHLVERFSGSMNGQPFEGMGIFGYNNATNEFEHVWLDSFNTGKMWSHGAKAGNAITLNGESHCAMGPMTCRSVMTKVNDNSYHFEMFGTLAAMPGEMKMMEIDYTRGASR